MNNPRICILVLNWNGAEDTLECLESLSKLTYSNAESVVIDNGSTDDSIRRIQKAYPEVQILELPENLLFGGGNNKGLEWAQEQGYAYVIFLNNDTTVEPDFVEPLLDSFTSMEKVGIVAPLMCYASEPKRIWYAGGKVNLWTGTVAHRHIRDSVATLRLQPTATDYITGCCLMMPIALATEMGGFHPDFKMYGEDVDLSLRVKQAGYQLIFNPDSTIYHKVSASVGGEFGLRKMIRKASGLLKLFRKHVRWYQWGTLIGSQVLLLMYNFGRVLNLKLRATK